METVLRTFGDTKQRPWGIQCEAKGTQHGAIGTVRDHRVPMLGALSGDHRDLMGGYKDPWGTNVEP